MPRKTRKQKERTQKKRAEGTFLNPGADLVKREFHFSEKDLFRLEENQPVIKKFDKSLSMESVASPGRDLVKTLILALVIFASEAVLYLALFKK